MKIFCIDIINVILKKFWNGKKYLGLTLQTGLYIFEFLKSVVGIHIWSIFSISFYIELYLLIPFNSKFILDTKLCSFCNVEDETVEHLFLNCPLIFPFLRDFYDCLKCYFHNIEFHKEQFLLGFKEEGLTLNLLILIAKNYIYKCKLKKKFQIS
jgi:hypothetical protein